MRKINRLLCWLLLSVCHAQAQGRVDTSAIIREFNQVLSFSIQPYLHYSSVILLRTAPRTDSAMGVSILHNEFYKVKDDLYYGNEQEEIYLQDSLMIRINHSRKMIQLGKVDVATKKKIDLLPLKNGDMQKMLLGNCTLSREADKGDTGQIVICSKEKQTPQGAASSEMAVVYRRGSHMPLSMELRLHMRQPGTKQMLELLKAQGFDVEKMESEVNGKSNLVMTQIASVSFGDIEMTKEKAVQMPLWKEKVDYDEHLQIYSGKGQCEGYEIVKTF